ncbi:SRPBCC family protein [Streptomyces sp. NPDC053427]|uniref:SRPBCC family protein n=1 Tax=Streptomyces sp. NPDC053427 TaxID=3365701 RepID=UPI0037D0A6C6
MSERVREVEESLAVPSAPAAVHAALADVRRMKERSPEVIWTWRRGNSFVGVNRRACWVWFTTCRIVIDDPGREFAFDVTTFGLPVARWGYRLTPAGEGTLVTEYWRDHRRRGWRGRTAEMLGLVFTGTPAGRRAARNRDGMRTTLLRLRAECREADAGPPGAVDTDTS